MTGMENMFSLAMIALVMVGVLVVLAYHLGRKEGYEKALDEMDKEQRRRGIANYPAKKSRRRTY